LSFSRPENIDMADVDGWPALGTGGVTPLEPIALAVQLRAKEATHWPTQKGADTRPTRTARTAPPGAG